jgi:hypothetical protein
MFQQRSALAVSCGIASWLARRTGTRAVADRTYQIGDELVASAKATVFVIFVRRDGVQLVEISPDDFVADTWHATIADAKRDAGLEETVWRLVPTEEEDPVDFARSLNQTATC